MTRSEERYLFCEVIFVISRAVAALISVFAATTAWADPIGVLVTTLPQKELVEKIGGDAVAVTVMVPQGADPHSYEPKPSQVQAASSAKVWFTVGMPLEASQLDRVKAVAPDLKVVPLASVVEPVAMKTALEIEDEAEECHDENCHECHDKDAHHGDKDCHHDKDGHHDSCTCGQDKDGHDKACHDEGCHDCHDSDCHHDACECGHEEGHHHHHHHHDGQPDPHLWLSAKCAVPESELICKTLSELLPDQAETFKANQEKFAASAAELDSKLADILKNAKGKAFLTFHPAWGYFARDYGLIQVPIEVEGKEPGPQTLAKITDFAKSQGVKALIVEPQFSTQSASAVAKSLGVPMVTVDPLAPNWEDSLISAAQAIANGVK